MLVVVVVLETWIWKFSSGSFRWSASSSTLFSPVRLKLEQWSVHHPAFWQVVPETGVFWGSGSLDLVVGCSQLTKLFGVTGINLVAKGYYQRMHDRPWLPLSVLVNTNRTSLSSIRFVFLLFESVGKQVHCDMHCAPCRSPESSLGSAFASAIV